MGWSRKLSSPAASGVEPQPQTHSDVNLPVKNFCDKKSGKKLGKNSVKKIRSINVCNN
jgi:hypothetical protein